MEIAVLREFVSLAENLNFSTTAKRLFVTQSTLSRHIAALENELGCKLFERTSRRMQLTAEGEAFYEDAKHLVGAADAAVARIMDVRSTTRAPLRIGYLYDATSNLIPALVKWFSEEIPGFCPEFTSLEYGHLMRALMERSIDVAFTMDIDPEERAQYDSFDLYTDCYYLAVSAGDPLAERDSFTVDEIRAIDNLIWPDKSVVMASHALFAEILGSDEGLSISSFYRDMRTLMLQISHGFGVSLVAGHHAMCRDCNVKLIPIEGRDTCFHISAMWKHDASPAFAEVFGAMDERFGMRDGRPSRLVRDMIPTLERS